MINYKIGDIVLVEFPFSDQQLLKRRPGLILHGASEDDDVILARITTRAPRGSDDAALNHWAEAGLPRSSTVRLAKIATIDKRLINRVIGHLHPDDALTIVQSLRELTDAIFEGLQGE